jgi:hypothetical protein
LGLAAESNIAGCIRDGHLCFLWALSGAAGLIQITIACLLKMCKLFLFAYILQGFGLSKCAIYCYSGEVVKFFGDRSMELVLTEKEKEHLWAKVKTTKDLAFGGNFPLLKGGTICNYGATTGNPFLDMGYAVFPCPWDSIEVLEFNGGTR